MKHLFHWIWTIDFDALRAKLESIVAFITFTVTSFSLLSNMLPKYERMTGDKTKAAWKGITKVVAFLALNWRMHLPGMNWRIGAMKDAPKEAPHDNCT